MKNCTPRQDESNWTQPLLQVSRCLFLNMAVALLFGCVTVKSDPCRSVSSVPLATKVSPPGFLRERPDSRSAIVFVHGLLGNAIKTWTNSNGTYWPSLVLQDPAFDRFDVYVYEYTSGTARDCTRIPDLAAEMQLRLAPLFRRYEEVLFVGHSMGGLVIRELLLTFGEPYPARTVALVFFGTPTGGTQVADRVSILTDCVDDLRRLAANSFLKKQVYAWQNREPALQRIQTFCGTESDERIVDTASSSLLCETSRTIFKDHNGLVKPACSNDLSHIFLREAIKSISSHQRLPVSDPDEDVKAFLQKHQIIRSEKDVLQFWETIGYESDVTPLEADALLRLRQSPPNQRLVTLFHGFKAQQAAKRLSLKARAIVRAVVGVDPQIRVDVEKHLRMLSASVPDDTDVRKAISATAKALGIAIAFPTDPEISSNDVKDRDRRMFLSAFGAWPKLQEAIEEYIRSKSDESLAAIGQRYKELSPASQRHFRETFTRLMLQSAYATKADVCKAMKVVSIHRGVGEGVVSLLRQPTGGAEYAWGVVDGNCLDNDHLTIATQNIVSRLVAGTDSGVTRFAVEHMLYDLIRSLPGDASHHLALRLLQIAAKQKGSWITDGIRKYVSREDESVIPATFWRSLLDSPVACEVIGFHPSSVLGRMSITNSQADLIEVWQRLQTCGVSVSTLARLINDPTVSMLGLKRRARFLLFREAVDSVIRNHGSVDRNRASVDLEALRSLVNDMPENLVRDARLEVLVRVQTADEIRNLDVPALMAAFLECLSHLTREEVAHLDRIAVASTHNISLPGRIFFWQFPLTELPASAHYFLDTDPTSASPVVGNCIKAPQECLRQLLWELREADTNKIARAAAQIQSLLTQVDPDRVVEAILDFVRPILTSDERQADDRVYFLKLLTPPLKAAVREEAYRISRANPQRIASLRAFAVSACESGDSRQRTILRELEERLLYADTACEVRTAALGLTSCGNAWFSPEQKAPLLSRLGSLVAQSTTVLELTCVIETLAVFELATDAIGDRLWNRLAVILALDPSDSAQSTASSLVTRFPVPTPQAAVSILDVPFLSEKLEAAILQRISSVYEIPMTSVWDAINWLSSHQEKP
jgi:pimeloyl-ACP methyl ester carboxylesterase